jgi:CheY-like chemotaxis protein/HPt (histidine-containing phosphotransfer) domain-containing protein
MDAPHQILVEDPASGRPLRILVAEDSVMVQRVVRGMLERCGHQVTIVSNGLEALDAAERDSFDVVLMDVQMPVLDGLEATRRWRRRETATGRRVPIIAVTAHGMAGDREACLAAGMDAHLSKPIGMDALCQVLAEVVPDGAGSSIEPSKSGFAQTANTNLFDPAAALANCRNRPERLRDLIRLFERESDGLMADLGREIEAGRLAECVRPAHTMAGSAGSLAAAATAQAARDLETACRKCDAPAAAAAWSRLRQELANLRTTFSRILGENESADSGPP